MTANEELFDDEFYQEDFSTASVFEAFVSRLSELFENYENFDKEPLHKNQLSLCDWTEEDENISFNEFELTVTRYKCKLNGSDELMETSSSAIDTVFQDLTSMENDYCLLDVRHFRRDPDSTSSKFIHPIAVWYGLRDFAVVRCRRKILYDMSDIKMLQSAMNLAVIDSKCKIPTFIQIMDPEQNVFVGVYDNCEHRVSFEIAHLKVPPPSCKYLSGLLDIFRGKVDIAYQNPAIVSVCLGYSVKNFSSLTFVTQKSNEIDDWDMTDFFGTISTLPFGISSDPVSELILYTKWPQVTENVVFDSQTYSDFNPLNAPKWSLRFRYDTTPVTFLADTLHEYCTLTESPEALYEYYGFLATKNRSFENARNPFAALTDSKIPSLPNVFEQPSYTIEGPISEEQMNGILEFVLPDERLASYQYKISESDEKIYDPLRMKSSPPDSVITRLSVILANIYTTFGGRRGVAQFWTEFSQRIRMRFDDGKIVPGVSKGFPDMRTCLLHQKLQMLNICIERKLLREKNLNFTTNASNYVAEKEDKNDSDDEFYDCDEDEQQQSVDIGENYSRFQSPYTPVGRLEKLGNMLLIDCDEPLYIPITQDPVPKTEDELEDDAEMLLNVSDGELRAQLMSASLLSDMESFKAANPKAKLEDFIRWYSPRDWIVSELSEEKLDEFGRSGELSDRMKIPGNTWQNVWNSAKAVPARRQKRLFDDTKEAEKVLHFLESQTLGSIGQLTIPSLFHSALMKLDKEATDIKSIIPNFEAMQHKIKQNCCSLSREKWISSVSKKKWENIVNEISEMEWSINQAKSIMMKLEIENSITKHENQTLIIELMKNHEATLNEDMKSTIGGRVIKLFKNITHHEHSDSENLSSFPPAIERQFVLRLSGNTQHEGMGGPQFLRTIMTPYDFRLIGAFTRNLSFSFEM